MPRMSSEVIGRLIGPSVPDEVVQNGATPARAAFVAQATFTRTGIEVTVPQVYEGIGWLRDNASRREPPWLTLPGIGGGYFRSLNPAVIQAALTPRLRYSYTHLRRTRTGVILPYADLVMAPNDPEGATDLITSYNDVVAAVGRLI